MKLENLRLAHFTKVVEQRFGETVHRDVGEELLEDSSCVDRGYRQTRSRYWRANRLYFWASRCNHWCGAANVRPYRLVMLWASVNRANAPLGADDKSERAYLHRRDLLTTQIASPRMPVKADRKRFNTLNIRLSPNLPNRSRSNLLTK